MSEKFVQIYKYIIKHKYFVIILIFLAWMLFLDEDNLFSIIKKKSDLNHIYGRENELIQKIEQDSIMLNKLESNNIELENYAREQFFYHKSDEQVYKIIYKKSNK